MTEEEFSSGRLATPLFTAVESTSRCLVWLDSRNPRLWLSLLLSAWLITTSESKAQDSKSRLNPFPKKLSSDYEKYRVAPSEYESLKGGYECLIAAPPFSIENGEVSPGILPDTDPFLIQTAFDCSDIKLVEDALKKVLESVGMSVGDSENPSTFSASLLDNPGAQDGDFADVKMSWSIEQPGKRIEVSVLYKRVIWVQSTTYGPRRVSPGQAGLQRFAKLKAAIMHLQLPVAIVSVSPPPTTTGVSASVSATPQQ